MNPANGDVLVAEAGAVDVFEPVSLMEGHYKILFRITETQPGTTFASAGPLRMAVGVAGEILVAGPEQREGKAVATSDKVVNEYNATGEYEGRLEGTGPGEPFASVNSIAVDNDVGSTSYGDAYVGDYDTTLNTGAVDVFGEALTIPDVKAQAPVEVEPRSATLHGTLNPEGLEVKSCAFEYAAEGIPARFAPCTEPTAEEIAVGPGEVPVKAKVEHLAADTTYHVRLLASNKNDEGEPTASAVESLQTTGPGIVSTSVSKVGSTSVTFDAEVNPDGAATSYYFEYGTEAGSYEHRVPVAPGEPIGAGTSPLEVPGQPVSGLSPGTRYHYRVVALSEVNVGPGETKEFPGEDHTFTTQASGTFDLPDGRSYELVSPPDKHGAQIEPISAQWTIQAAAGGGTMAWVADAPTESNHVAGYVNRVQVLSTRTSSGWESKDLAVPHDVAPGLQAGFSDEFQYFSEDLSQAVAHPFGAFIACTSAENVKQPCLSEEASESTALLRDNTTGTYTPLVTSCPDEGKPCPAAVREHADDTSEPFQPFGEEGQCVPHEGVGAKAECGPEFLGGTEDLAHVVLNSGFTNRHVALTKTAISDGGLYEWSAGVAPSERLKLVSLLPPTKEEADNGEPGLPASNPQLGLQNEIVRNAISGDGSRVIWSSFTTKHLYLRDLAREGTVQLDVPEAGCEIEGECGQGKVEARFQLASSNGERVFFTDTQALTHGADHPPNTALNGDLYECAIIEGATGPECQLTDLTPPIGGEPDEAVGVVTGASQDGSWVYFVAQGRLAAGAVAGGPNLYVRHGGVTRLVAVLSSEDVGDWAGKNDSNLNTLTARSSPDGRYLAFMSERSLTGYDNTDAVSGVPDEEVYLYHAPEHLETESGTLNCASCDPTGARPHGRIYGGPVEPAGIVVLDESLVGGFDVWGPNTWLAGNVPGYTPYEEGRAIYQSRYLSNEGRLFFNSRDSLVPRDVNEQEDVYEYEPENVPLGSEHACSPASVSGSEVFKPGGTFDAEGGQVTEAAGCVALISSGTSDKESAFLDASESGGDVFFLTSEQLVPQDVDDARDVYDAHECTSASPCLPTPAATRPPCETEASCKAAPEPQPSIYGAGGTATFSGPGNVAPPPVVAPKKKTAAEVRAEKLAKALKQCHKDRKKSKRLRCEKAARQEYGAAKKSKRK